MARLLLLRHAQSSWNAEGRWQGWADPPLSPAGEAHARAAAAWLRAVGWAFDAAASSDLRRSSHTADIVAETLGMGQVRLDAGLRERDVGAWSGLTRAEIDQRWPGAVDSWRAGDLERPPGGESDGELSARVVAALWRVADGGGRRPAPPTGPSSGRREPAVLVVTHGGAIRALERHLGADPCRPGNLCGRWVEAGGGRLLPGDPVAVPPVDDAAVTAVS